MGCRAPPSFSDPKKVPSFSSFFSKKKNQNSNMNLSRRFKDPEVNKKMILDICQFLITFGNFIFQFYIKIK